MSLTLVTSGAERTVAMVRAPAGAVTFVTGASTSSASASCSPAVIAGLSTRGEYSLSRSVRAPSVISASIGAMSPPLMSSRLQLLSIVGPVYALVSTATEVTETPDLRTCSARSLIRPGSV